ncbi:UvrD-like helicase C-terminal domain [Comamonas thiooxydans]|nr:UvrD-like helicase C-terminal domain [Comamonas thiooxydans]
MDVRPTPEQLALFSRVPTGVSVIRGAAGSGKTTTALLKLRASVGFHLRRVRRQQTRDPLKVLVLTFNRTLRGYIAELAAQQFEEGDQITLTVDTFSRWGKELVGDPKIIDLDSCRVKLRELAAALDLPREFAVDEALYVMGRFLPENFTDYLTARRDGRGTMPRMLQPARMELLERVIFPFMEYKNKNNLMDWNDIAVNLAVNNYERNDIVILDETQDFSNNEIRAVLNQISDEYTVTFVLDSAQRIYDKKFIWSEVGLNIRPENSHRLISNYRNTREIAQFAAALLEGIVVDDDGSLPDFSSANRIGPKPNILIGRYPGQIDFAVNFIRENVDLNSESVAFLHPKGYGWFSYTKRVLQENGMDYVSIERKVDWPGGDENIALSTLHSAKGLEFDHVFILGLDEETLADYTADNEDDIKEQEIAARRLVAMGVGRARKTVTIGYRPDDAPRLAEFFNPAFCTRVAV